MTGDTQVGAERIEIIVHDASDLVRARTILDVVAVGDVEIDDEHRRVSAAVDDGLESLGAALHQLHVSEVAIVGVRLRRDPEVDALCSCFGARR
jgi:ABC-2 type transport system ATP-binding protein